MADKRRSGGKFIIRVVSDDTDRDLWRNCVIVGERHEIKECNVCELFFSNEID